MYLTMRHTSISRTGGFSLIEVLVAVLVLAIGLLGLAGLQASGLRYSGDAVLRTQAVTLAQDIIERMRANPEGVKNSPAASDTYYKITSTLTGTLPDCTGSTCSSATMATYDVLLWQQTLTQRLPNGQGTINVTDPGGAGLYYNVAVTVSWKERQTESGASTDRSLVLVTQI